MLEMFVHSLDETLLAIESVSVVGGALLLQTDVDNFFLFARAVRCVHGPLSLLGIYALSAFHIF